MHRCSEWFAIFLIICSLLVTLEAEQPFVHGSDVAFTIKTDQTTYVMGEPIVIRYGIKNVSNGALFVPKSRWGIQCVAPPYVWARLEDRTGKHYEPGYAGSCLGPGPYDRMSVPERMRRDAVLVKPGQAVHGHFVFQPRVFSDLKPGSYRLEAILYGWNLSFSTSELSELHRMGAPFLIGEINATIRVELQAASRH